MNQLQCILLHRTDNPTQTGVKDKDVYYCTSNKVQSWEGFQVGWWLHNAIQVPSSGHLSDLPILVLASSSGQLKDRATVPALMSKHHSAQGERGSIPSCESLLGENITQKPTNRALSGQNWVPWPFLNHHGQGGQNYHDQLGCITWMWNGCGRWGVTTTPWTNLDNRCQGPSRCSTTNSSLPFLSGKDTMIRWCVKSQCQPGRNGQVLRKAQPSETEPGSTRE